MDAKAITGAFTGKHKGVFIGGAIAVAALAYFMRDKSGGTTEAYADTYPTDTGSSIGSGGGSSGGITSDQLVSALDANSKTFAAQLAEEKQARLDYQNGIVSAVNNLSSTFDSRYASLNAGLDSLQDHVTEPIYTPLQQAGGFNQLASAGGTGQVTQDYHAPVSQPASNQTPVFGNGGIDFNAKTTTTAQKQSIISNEKKIAEDASFRASELVRANEVKKANERTGVSTKDQDAYIAKLQKLGA